MNALQSLLAGLDPVLSQRSRLAIVCALTTAPRLTFTQLRRALRMTDGNLSAHLRKLENAHYIAIDKQFAGLCPVTSATLTRAGLVALGRYLDQLEAVVRQGRG